MDTHTCFCFECDSISWDVLEHYPLEPVNRIYHLLEGRHSRRELEEVVGELEWLRVTKAILAPPDDKTLIEQATRVAGLRDLILLPGTRPMDASWLTRAGLFLLAGSGGEKNLNITLFFTEIASLDLSQAAPAVAEIGAMARLAGKRFSIEMDIPFRPLPESLKREADCAFRLKVSPSAGTDLAGFLDALMDLVERKPGTALEALQKKYAPESVRIVAQPLSERFHAVIKTLHKAGYADMTIDLPGAWMAQPQLHPEEVGTALRANAAYYAEQLLKNVLFRAEPFACLFNAIYKGTPCYRADTSGVESLAVDREGRVYPSPLFAGNPDYVLGSLAEGHMNAARRESFMLSGTLQTPACLRCWARGLCGGGHAAIHYARTGNTHTPDASWCDAQRHWISEAVATFNRISSAGIHFDHLVAAIQPQKQRFSLFQAAKALFQGYLAVRPLREEDAAILVRWENWNRAAYFLCNETGALTTTQYDREMDALHPLEDTQELMLTLPDGSPRGLLKMRPFPEKGLVCAWLYLHDPALYAKTALHQTLRALVAEACRAPQIRHIVTPVTAKETKLAEALVAIGFVHAGTARESLYQKGAYHDVLMYVYTADV